MKQPKPFIVHKPVPVSNGSRLLQFRCVTCGKLLDDEQRNKRCKGSQAVTEPELKPRPCDQCLGDELAVHCPGCDEFTKWWDNQIAARKREHEAAQEPTS